MLFRKHIVSTRTLSQLAVALVFSLVGIGTAMAAGAINPPLLVPYTDTVVAGDTQFHGTSATAPTAGYTGDLGSAISYIYCSATITTNCVYTPTASLQGTTVLGAEMSAPHAVAVDSVGNVYITDTNNAVVREVNAVTGVINTIAGTPPVGGKAQTGCSDGTPAYGSKIGSSIAGIAVDNYGNVYFDDATSTTVSVVYKGGAQLAAFIKLVNPGAVAVAGGVLPGYLYHIAGTINVGSPTNTGATCAAISNYNGVTSDNALAFENSATVGSGAIGASLGTPGLLSLDSAGNIYISDVKNATVRVINTQSTPQTFFQYTVQPGYMRSITNCNGALTILCPAVTSVTAGTGINGPVNEVVSTNQWVGAYTDPYGNVFSWNGTGGSVTPPGYYAGVAYAGGAPITSLLTAEAPFLTTVYGPNGLATGAFAAPPELPLIYGDWYIVIDNPAAPTITLPNNDTVAYGINAVDVLIRATAMSEDTYGTVYYNDNHYPSISRIDQYTSVVTDLNGGGGDAASHDRATASVSGVYTSYASFTNPWYCVYGSSGAANNFLSQPAGLYPQTFDPAGDGCPASVGYFNIMKYNMVSDAGPNLYNVDSGWNIVHEFTVGNTFPATALATAVAPHPVTQAIQIHFDAGNPPVGVSTVSNVPDGGYVGYTVTGFSITPSTDFTINSTTPEFPMGSLINGSMSVYGNTPTSNSGNFQLWTGLPTCTQLGISLVPADTGYDCLVYVTFNPSAPGLRQAELVANTVNGGTYTFPLNGLGEGGQLAIDGGQQAKLTVNSSTALGTTAQVAVNAAGTVYIADPSNNRVVVQPTTGFGTTTGMTATTIGTGLKAPQGVAVDAAGNVYISDTGNNRVLKVTPNGTQTVLGNNVWVSGATCYPATGSPAGDCTLPTSVASVAALGPDPTPGAVTGTTAPPQYAFNGPEGLAVDSRGNVYVADTGNHAVVEIPSNIVLGGAFPLLFDTGVGGTAAGASPFVTPVSVAVDSTGNIYVADTGNPSGSIVQIPPGGGDLQPGHVVGLGSLINIPGLGTAGLGGNGITTPNGVAVDAAGNVYVSDSSTNLVWVAPLGGAPKGNPYTLNFAGLSSPAGIALDASGNLYVADSGNKQIVGVNRLNPTVSFGTVPQDLANASGVAGTPVGCPVAGSSTPCSGVLTVTNIGNQPVTLASTFLTVSGVNPVGDTAFAVTSTCNSLYSNSLLPAGDSCTISPTFQPTTDGSQSENISVNNGAQSIALVASTQGTGEQPLVNIALSSSVGLTPAAGSTAVITATVTQPHTPPGGTPTGTVTFSFVIDAGTANAGLCGAGATSAPIPLVNGVATYTIPSSLAQGLVYTVSATYNGDSLNSLTTATPIVLTVPGVQPITVTANSVSYTYGQAVPALTGTVTPTPPTGVTYSFTSGASQFSNVGTYPIQVVFSGGSFCSYGFPAATTTGGGAATVTENKAPLTVAVPDYTTVYGAATFNYNSGLVITGAVGNDLKKLSATFTNGPPPAPPAIPVAMDSSVLNVGVFQVYPTVTGKPVGNYTITIATSPLAAKNGFVGGGTDTVTSATAGIAVTAAAGVCNSNFSATATCELPSAVNKGTFTLSVGTLVAAGKGVPSGIVTVTDNFIPITPTFFDTSPNLQPAAPPSGMPACSSTVTTNCYAPVCTASMTGCYTYSPPCSSTVVTNCNTPCSATVTANCYAQPCSATVTSYCYTTYPSCSSTLTTNCNAPVALSAGSGVFSLPSTENTPGIHYLSFAYSGDLPLCTSTLGTNCIPPVCSTTQTTNCLPPPCSATVTTNCITGGPTAVTSDAVGDFNCTVVGEGAVGSCPTTGTTAYPLVVDFPDFNITSLTTLINVNPGTTPSGNGLPSAPGQNSAIPETGTLQIQGLLSFNGGGSGTGFGVSPMTVTCTTAHPSYVSCVMTPISTCLTTTSGNCLPAQSGTVTTTTVVLAVSTPANLPLGFNTSEVRTAATRTVLAFLPFGILAFCVRRRRRLSQVLWMLIAISAVSAGMIGCSGSNQSTLYTPIPTGSENVIINVAGTTPIAFTGTTTSGSATVTAVSSTVGLAAGQAIGGTGIPSGATIASIASSTSITLSANATSSATGTLTATLPLTRTYTIPINIF